MAKKSLASIELAAIINELQLLVNGKVSQIYHQDKEFIFQLHVSEKGKQYLRIVPGKFLCLTSKKEEMALKPSGFCMQLRKHLNNAIIRNVEQKEAERIVVLELEKEVKSCLIIELFSKGNVILTDENYQIIGVLEQQVWKERTVKVNEKYVFPPAPVNWKTLTEKELEAILKRSEKKNISTCLATEVGLGGVYAEEVSKLAGIDKAIAPKEAEAKMASAIIKSIKIILKLIEEPSGHFYEEEITPFPLAGLEEKRETKSYNEAINTLNPFVVISPYEKKIKTIEKRIIEQEKAIKEQEEKIELNTKKGELVYEKYQPLSKLLEIVKELRKDKEWSEVAQELKKEKRIKSVDLKNKRVTLDL